MHESQTFINAVSYIVRRDDYKNLFNEIEYQYLQSFDGISCHAKQFYVKLYHRKRDWVRIEPREYPEICPDLTALYSELRTAQLLKCSDSVDDFDQIVNDILNLSELTRLSALFPRDPRMKSSPSKSDLIRSLRRQASTRSVRDFFSTNRESKSTEKNKNEKTLSAPEKKLLLEAKKIIGSSAYQVVDEAAKLFARLPYLYFFPQVNITASGKVHDYDFIRHCFEKQEDCRYAEVTPKCKALIYQDRLDLIEYEAACHLSSKITAFKKRDQYKRLNSDKENDRNAEQDKETSKEKKDVKDTDQQKEPDKDQENADQESKGNEELESLLKQAYNGYYSFVASSAYSHAQSLPAFLRIATAGHRYLRCLVDLIEALEARKTKRMYIIAVELCKTFVEQNVFCLWLKGRLFERLIINLATHLKRQNEAWDYLNLALDDEHLKDPYRYQLFMKAEKMLQNLQSSEASSAGPSRAQEEEPCRHVKIFALGSKRDSRGARTIFFKDNSSEKCSVEDLVLSRLTSEGGFAKGDHSEGSVFHSLYALLLWDEIYNDELSDVFRSTQQKLPLDFFFDDFYDRRKTIIDDRLTELESLNEEKIAAQLIQSWSAHEGIKSIVNWEHSIDNLIEIAHCVGIKPLVAIIKRLCSGFRRFSQGFPDLIVWSFDNRQVLFVEVKGPGDRLSTKQHLWLEFLERIGLDCQITSVAAEPLTSASA